MTSDETSLRSLIRGDAYRDPGRLCEFLLQECKDRGVQVHHPAQAVSVAKDMRGELAAVRIATNDGLETDRGCYRNIVDEAHTDILQFRPLAW